MDWATTALELVWMGGLAATPVAVFAAVCSRCRAFRPATRHSVWIAVLATFIAPTITAGLWRADWFRSERVLAAADSLVRPEAAPVIKKSEPAAPRIDSSDRAVSRSVPRSAQRTGPTAIKPAEADKQRHAAAAKPDPKPTIIDKPAVHQPSPARSHGPAPAVAAPASAPAITQDPVSPAAATPAPRRADSWNDQFRGWTVSILAVRDALAAVPPIPPMIWLGGAGLAALVCLVRIAHTRRIVRRGDPAPLAVEAMVRRVARIAGVARPPTVVMVPDRVSPMIWCGLRPRLVLPRALWDELDPQSQCAVIVHELSHLRRRDHWLCWAEGLIALAYWWHPVAWWARRRLHDEAEACCDAWVTTLMPNGRRAYAEALVATKSFLSVPGGCGAPGLGVLNGRTRQLARRLTMVMTQRVAPRASMVGLAFALAVAAAGTLVMPSLACPPTEEKAKADAEKTRVKAQAQAEKAREKAMAGAEKSRAESEKVRVKIQAQAEKSQRRAATRESDAAKRSAERAARAQEQPQFLGEAPALESMRRSRSGDAPQAARAADLEKMARALQEREQALRQLEQRLQEMERRLDQLQGQQNRPGRRSGLTPAAPMAAPSFAAPAMAPSPAAPPAPPAPPSAPAPVTGQATSQLPALSLLYSTRVAQPTYASEPLMGLMAARPAPDPVIAVQDGATEARSYTLPEGKLEAFTELLGREDVPILIERQEGQIVIHATPGQHRILGAFIRMISPENGAQGVDLAPEAYTIVTPQGDSLPELQTYYERLGHLDMATQHAQTAGETEHLRAELETLRDHLTLMHEHVAQVEEGDEDCCEGQGDCDADDADTDVDQPDADEDSDDEGVDLSRLDELTAHIDAIEAQLEAIDSMTAELDGQFELVSGQLEALAALEAPEATPEPAIDIIETPAPDEPAQPTPPAPAQSDPLIPTSTR